MEPDGASHERMTEMGHQVSWYDNYSAELYSFLYTRIGVPLLSNLMVDELLNIRRNTYTPSFADDTLMLNL